MCRLGLHAGHPVTGIHPTMREGRVVREIWVGFRCSHCGVITDYEPVRDTERLKYGDDL